MTVGGTAGPGRRRRPDDGPVAYPRGRVLELDHGVRVLRDARGVIRLLGGDPLTLVTPAHSAAARLAGRRFRVEDAVSGSLARALTERGIAHPSVATPGEPGTRHLDAVTAVVPVRDDPEGLRSLLGALAPDLDRGLRVVVVDDGSSTPVEVHDRRVTVLRAGRSVGPAAARNAGTERALADRAVATEHTEEGEPDWTEYGVLVYLDADVAPHPGWLDPLLAHLDDPAVWVVAPRIVAYRPARSGVAGYETACSSLDMGPHPARVRPRTRVPYLPSAAMVVRAEALGRISRRGSGPFDPEMQVAEDVDLCWRVVDSGGVVRYEPASRVAHRHRSGLWATLRRKAYYGTGAVPLARRHGDAVAPAVASGWSSTLALGLWSATPAGLLAAAGAAGWACRRTRATVGDGPTSARLVARAAAASTRQLPSALLRPYWPVTAAVVLGTARLRGPVAAAARRRLLVAAVVEGLWHWWEHREPGALPTDDPVSHLLLHRLDDLAYGAGVWSAVLARGQWSALRPELRR